MTTSFERNSISHKFESLFVPHSDMSLAYILTLTHSDVTQSGLNYTNSRNKLLTRDLPKNTEASVKIELKRVLEKVKQRVFPDMLNPTSC